MKETNSKCGKLSACNLGTSLGVVYGLSLFVLVALNMSAGIGTQVLKLLSSLYAGYHPTLIGAFLGLAWGFIHGFVFGAILAGVYNYCRCACPCTYCKGDRCKA